MEVIKFANGGRIPLACGVRVDGKDRLSNVVDHLFSPAHNELSLRLKQLDESWDNSSGSHPWIKVMKKCKAETMEILLRLAVDVYNDCRTSGVGRGGHWGHVPPPTFKVIRKSALFTRKVPFFHALHWYAFLKEMRLCRNECTKTFCRIPAFTSF